MPSKPLRVAVVVPNHNGKHHLDTCLASLRAQEVVDAEVVLILVDNGSTDGSVEHLQERHPDVRLLISETNRGFAGACNLAVREHPDVDVFVFLNNDMRVAADWLHLLLDPIRTGRAHAVTSKILSWDGEVIDFAGGGMNFHGIGIARGHGELAATYRDEGGPSLFACGGSMAVDAAAYRDSGGFDDDFFAYYEDVDLGWRMWILGYRIEYEPRSLTYHHLSATARTFGFERIRLLQIRNPLLSILKNYEEEAFRRVLPVALLLTVQRTTYLAGLPEDSFRIEKSSPRGRTGFREFMRRAIEGFDDRLLVPKIAMADLIALHDFGRMMPAFLAKRREIQERRQRRDRELRDLFHDPFWAVEPPSEYAELQRLLVEYFGIADLFE